MNEKLSEKSIRMSKVVELKAKIIKEIAEEHDEIKLLIGDCKNDFDMLGDCENDFDMLVEEYYQLLQLKKYVEDDNSFCRYEAIHGDIDVIIYSVSSEEIDIWLQDDYNFVACFMDKVREMPEAIFGMLNDDYFGYQFTNIFDKIAYDKKKNTR